MQKLPLEKDVDQCRRQVRLATIMLFAIATLIFIQGIYDEWIWKGRFGLAASLLASLIYIGFGVASQYFGVIIFAASLVTTLILFFGEVWLGDILGALLYGLASYRLVVGFVAEKILSDHGYRQNDDPTILDDESFFRE